MRQSSYQQDISKHAVNTTGSPKVSPANTTTSISMQQQGDRQRTNMNGRRQAQDYQLSRRVHNIPTHKEQRNKQRAHVQFSSSTNLSTTHTNTQEAVNKQRACVQLGSKKPQCTSMQGAVNKQRAHVQFSSSTNLSMTHTNTQEAVNKQRAYVQLGSKSHNAPACKEQRTSRGLTFSSAANATMEERCHSELSYSMCPTTDPSLASKSSRKMSTLELPVWMGSTLLVVTPSRSMPDSSVLGCRANSTWPCHNSVSAHLVMVN